MTAVAGGMNVVLGLVYLSYGILTWIELRRGWPSRGASHFGLAWLFMAFTCGPHHLDHGLHLLLDGGGGAIDVATTALGFPAGVTWFLLRIEAVRGGSGDRVVRGDHPLVEALPTAHATYAVVLAGLAGSAAAAGIGRWTPTVVPNLLLVVLYALVGAVLLRTQVVNHRSSGAWSLSGLALTMVFPTCAVMHGVHALQVTVGTYGYVGHLLVIDVLAVPSAVYFLWAVLMLSTGRLQDWSEAAGHSSAEATDDLAVPAGVVTG